MNKFEKFCQSCSMPLDEGDRSGTEKDGSKSFQFCELCYQNGEFTNPYATIEDMKKLMDNTVGKEGVIGKIKAWMGKMMLPNLKRWKSSI